MADKDEEDLIEKQRDHGWAWLVLAASFLIQVVIDGIVSSYSIIFNELQLYFPNLNKSILALPGSLHCGLFLFLGPLASTLVNSFGLRLITSVGGISVFVGLFVASFFFNFYFFLVFYGVFGGIGLGLSYLPAVIAPNYYFSKYRALANGIAMAGAGVGYLIFPSLTAYLIDAYGLRGTLTILAAVCFNIIPCGLMFRPISITVSKRAVDSSARKGLLVDTQIDDQETIRPTTSDGSATAVFHSTTSIVLKPHDQKDIFYSADLTSLQRKAEYGASSNLRQLSPRDWKKSMTKHFALSLFKDRSFTFLLIGFSLVQMGYFVPLVYLIDFAMKNVKIGSLEKASSLMLYFGLSHVVGRVGAGAVINLGVINALPLYILCCVVSGVINFMMFFVHDFAGLVVYATIYAFMIGIYPPSTTIVLVDFLGIEKLTDSFGIASMIRGLFSFFGPFIAGALLDSVDNYLAVFILAGSVISLAGVSQIVLCFFKPNLQKSHLSLTQNHLAIDVGEKDSAVSSGLLAKQAASNA